LIEFAETDIQEFLWRIQIILKVSWLWQGEDKRCLQEKKTSQQQFAQAKNWQNAEVDS